MKKMLPFYLYFILMTPLFAQSPVAQFDGVNDYIDLGETVGNGIRTIELWFKLEENISPDLNEFVALVAREISITDNTNEFSFSFQPDYVPHSGTLRFDVNGTPPYTSVYSDQSTWYRGQWYHAAAVIDPIEGMMLFVDGVKQESTHVHNAATTNSDRITTIGCWGDAFIRHFEGYVEDVRFSSEALYTDDFTPSCPDLSTQMDDIGLWNFNEDAGTAAIDASLNGNEGSFIGADRSMEFICVDEAMVSIEDLEINNRVTVYPNPSKGIFCFSYEASPPFIFDLVVYNAIGQMVLKRTFDTPKFELQLPQTEHFHYQILVGGEVLQAGKLMRQ